MSTSYRVSVGEYEVTYRMSIGEEEKVAFEERLWYKCCEPEWTRGRYEWPLLEGSCEVAHF